MHFFYKPFVFYFFLFFFIYGCNNHIDLNKDGSIRVNNNKTLILNKTDKPYVLRDLVIVPENHTLLINSGVSFIFKKGGKIINNGSVVFEKNQIFNKDSSSYIFYKKSIIDTVINYSIHVSSFDNSFNHIENHVNSSIVINNVFFENINISSFSGIKFFINNSNFNNCKIKVKNSKLSIFDSFLYKQYLKTFNSEVILNNSFFKNIQDSLIFFKNKNTSINNCLISSSKQGVFFENCYNNNIINSVFFENKKAISINNNNKYLKLYNNLFIKNDLGLNIKDTVQLFIINNTFEENKKLIKYINTGLYKKNIISKNNIYFNNKENFDLFNVHISNSYCISNTDTLSGYYNIYSNPFYIDSKNYNYKLLSNSPALRSGTNNKNLGVNINTINIIKYLKY